MKPSGENVNSVNLMVPNMSKKIKNAQIMNAQNTASTAVLNHIISQPQQRYDCHYKVKTKHPCKRIIFIQAAFFHVEQQRHPKCVKEEESHPSINRDIGKQCEYICGSHYQKIEHQPLHYWPFATGEEKSGCKECEKPERVAQNYGYQISDIEGKNCIDYFNESHFYPAPGALP